jgi:hypothetical protein
MEVNNNKFISSRRPYLVATVSPQFKYLAHFKFEQNRLNVNKSKTHRITTDSFFFIPNATINGLLSKYIYIMIEENQDSFFVQPFLISSNNQSDWSHRKLGWYDYEQLFGISFPLVENDEQLKRLIPEGFTMPKCVFKMTTARIVGTNKAIKVVYGEDCELSGFEQNKWRDRTKLNEEQIKYIDGFGKRASSFFEVMESD